VIRPGSSPRAAVNLIAFESRFISISRSCSGSASSARAIG
jgi:hypothetical protein